MKTIHPSIYFTAYFVAALLTYGCVREGKAREQYKRHPILFNDINEARNFVVGESALAALLWPIYWPLVATETVFDKYAGDALKNEK